MKKLLKYAKNAVGYGISVLKKLLKKKDMLVRTATTNQKGWDMKELQQWGEELRKDKQEVIYWR